MRSSPRRHLQELGTEPTSETSPRPEPRIQTALAKPTTRNGNEPASHGAALPARPISHKTKARSPLFSSLPLVSSSRMSSTQRLNAPPPSLAPCFRPHCRSSILLGWNWPLPYSIQPCLKPIGVRAERAPLSRETSQISRWKALIEMERSLPNSFLNIALPHWFCNNLE